MFIVQDSIHNDMHAVSIAQGLDLVDVLKHNMILGYKENINIPIFSK